MKLILQAIRSAINGVYADIKKTRTHYDERKTLTKTYTFDGTLDGKEYIDSGDGSYMVKLGDELPAKETVLEMALGYTENGEIKEIDGITTADWREIEDGVYVYEMILFNFGEECNTNGFSVSRGIWVVFTPDEIMVSYVKLTSTSGELKKLDVKYIPDILHERIAHAQATADAAQTTADAAQTTAENAFSGMVVTFTGSNLGGYKPNHSASEIYDCVCRGVSVFAMMGGRIYHLYECTLEKAVFVNEYTSNNSYGITRYWITVKSFTDKVYDTTGMSTPGYNNLIQGNVGQIYRISAVNDSGYPTHIEAIDP